MTLTGSDITGGPKFSARNPQGDRAQPSQMERMLDKVVTPNPPDQELFIGPAPGPNDIVDAIFERKKIVAEAMRLNSNVAEEKLQRMADAIFNGGFALTSIKKMAAMDASDQMIGMCKEVFEEAGITAPTVEAINALTAVCQAIVQHVHTHHAGAIPPCEIKTPFMAWRVKETLADFLLRSEPIEVNRGGPDCRLQVDQFYANFKDADLVLWNSDIWKAAIRGSESFINTPLTRDIIDSLTPMFWQFDSPLSFGPTGASEFELNTRKYDLAGFCLMPTTEDMVELSFPEEAVEFTPSKGDPNKGMAVVDFSNPEVKQAFDLARDNPIKFARSGISIAIVFMPRAKSNMPPEVRFHKPIFEDDEIETTLSAIVFAAAKFLTLKYVAQDTVGVSKKELKADRHLFKQVRKEKVTVPPIKIINLRRPERRTKSEVAEENTSKRQYKCHFMVDPHWRKQWYPSISRYKPVRILTYVKGNMSAPFKAPREKVYKAVR